MAGRDKRRINGFLVCLFGVILVLAGQQLRKSNARGNAFVGLRSAAVEATAGGLAFSSKSSKLVARQQAPVSDISVATEAHQIPQTLVPRVVLDPLPKVYVYDHCPFCVRVRFALGLKNVKHEARFMMNDDKETPMALLGKKIAPIWEHDGEVMGESMDIIEKVDSDPRFGVPGFFRPASGRKDLKAWQKKYKAQMRILQRPRYVDPQTIIPEFQQREAREYFISGHEVPYPEAITKAAWKELDLATQLANYEGALLHGGDQALADVNEGLKELDDLVYSEEYCTKGGLSYDDIDLWSRLRSLTIIKGIQFPAKLRRYMDNLAVQGDVPLYWTIAI